MSTWGARTVRDVDEVDLRGGHLVRLELLAEAACLHLDDLQTRYRDAVDPGFTMFRQDARLLLFGVSETTVSGGLTGQDPIASATLMDEDQQAVSWCDALKGAATASLEVELASGVTIALRCSRATLGLEGEAKAQDGKRAWDPSSQLEDPRPWRKEDRESTSPFRHGVTLPLSSM